MSEDIKKLMKEIERKDYIIQILEKDIEILEKDIEILEKDIEILEKDIEIEKIKKEQELERLYGILEQNNIKTYGFSSDFVDEFCNSEIGTKLESKYSHLKEHYLLVKDEHINTKNINNIIYKYITNFIDYNLNINLINQEIKNWIDGINNFSKSSMFKFLHIIVSRNSDINSMIENYDFLNITEKKEDLDKIMVMIDGMTKNEINDLKKAENFKQKVAEGLSYEYKKMFNEINNEFKHFLENKIKE